MTERFQTYLDLKCRAAAFSEGSLWLAKLAFGYFIDLHMDLCVRVGLIVPRICVM